jgi:hypothetical protein
LISLFLVYALVSLFLFYRLFLHVKANVSQPSGEVTLNSEAIMTGVRGWLVETEKRAGFPPMPKGLSPSSEKVELENDEEVMDEKVKIEASVTGARNDSQWNEKMGFVDQKPIDLVKAEK